MVSTSFLDPRRGMPWLRRLLAFVATTTALGCAPEIAGQASFPVLSKGRLPGAYEAVRTVNETRCTHVILFLAAWGDEPSHVALITDILEESKGDAIQDAELTYFSIPAFFYNRQCARVKGTVIRRASAGAPASGSNPSAPPPVATPAAPAPPASAASEGGVR